MKQIYFALLLIFNISALSAQEEKDNEAVFEECRNKSYPVNCTRAKIYADVYNLVNDKHLESLKSMEESNYFSLSFIFISDASGKVIPQETEVVCRNAGLKQSVENYIASLPVFIPKDASEGEKRTLHQFHMHYLFNAETKRYENKTTNEMFMTGLPYETITFGTAPLHKECTSLIGSEAEACTTKNFRAYILKKFTIPNVAYRGQIAMLVIFSVEADGKVSVSEVIGGAKPFSDEIKRVTRKMPAMQPAVIKGFPVRSQYRLPLTINVI